MARAILSVALCLALLAAVCSADGDGTCAGVYCNWDQVCTTFEDGSKACTSLCYTAATGDCATGSACDTISLTCKPLCGENICSESQYCEENYCHSYCTESCIFDQDCVQNDGQWSCVSKCNDGAGCNEANLEYCLWLYTGTTSGGFAYSCMTGCQWLERYGGQCYNQGQVCENKARECSDCHAYTCVYPVPECEDKDTGCRPEAGTNATRVCQETYDGRTHKCVVCPDDCPASCYATENAEVSVCPYDCGEPSRCHQDEQCTIDGKCVSKCSPACTTSETCQQQATGGYECVYNGCPVLTLEQGTVVYSSQDRVEGSTATYTCREGYQPISNGGLMLVSYCVHGAEQYYWEPYPPTCMPIPTCPELGVENALAVAYSNERYEGSVATVTCKSGFVYYTGDLSGQPTCSMDSASGDYKWIPLPHCVAVNLCSGVICEDGASCVDGQCITFGCVGGCPSDKKCQWVDGTYHCVDLCYNVACDDPTKYCDDDVGYCVSRCGPDCKSPSYCRQAVDDSGYPIAGEFECYTPPLCNSDTCSYGSSCTSSGACVSNCPNGCPSPSYCTDLALVNAGTGWGCYRQPYDCSDCTDPSSTCDSANGCQSRCTYATADGVVGRGCPEGQKCQQLTTGTTASWVCAADQSNDCKDAAGNYLCSSTEYCEAGHCYSQCGDCPDNSYCMASGDTYACSNVNHCLTETGATACHENEVCENLNCVSACKDRNTNLRGCPEDQQCLKQYGVYQCVDACNNACNDPTAPCNSATGLCTSKCGEQCDDNESCLFSATMGYVCTSNCGWCHESQICTWVAATTATTGGWKCEQKSCESNSQCPEGYYCQDRKCQWDYCSNDDCPASCNPSFGCYTSCEDIECADNEICSDPASTTPCKSKCNNGRGCASNEACDSNGRCYSLCLANNDGNPCPDSAPCQLFTPQPQAGTVSSWQCVDACGNTCHEDQRCEQYTYEWAGTRYSYHYCASKCATASGSGCTDAEDCNEVDGVWRCESKCDDCQYGERCLYTYTQGTSAAGTYTCGNACEKCHANETCQTYNHGDYSWSWCQSRCNNGQGCYNGVYGEECLPESEGSDRWICRNKCSDCKGYCLEDVVTHEYSCVPYCELDGCAEGSYCESDGYCYSHCNPICNWDRKCVINIDNEYVCESGCGEDCPSGYCYKMYDWSDYSRTTTEEMEGTWHCYDYCWDSCSDSQECVLSQYGYHTCQSYCADENGGKGCDYDSEKCVKLDSGWTCQSACEPCDAPETCQITGYDANNRWQPTFACKPPCYQYWTGTACGEGQECVITTWGDYSWGECKFEDPCNTYAACDWETERCEVNEENPTLYDCITNDVCANIDCGWNAYCISCDGATVTRGDYRCEKRETGVNYACVPYWGYCSLTDCSEYSTPCSYSYCNTAADGYSAVCVSYNYVDGTRCDDNNPATTGDKCYQGQCAGDACEEGALLCGDTCCASGTTCQKLVTTDSWGVNYEKQGTYYRSNVRYYCLAPLPSDAFCTLEDGQQIWVGDSYTSEDGCTICQCSLNIIDTTTGTVANTDSYGIVCLSTCIDPAHDPCKNLDCEAKGLRCKYDLTGAATCVDPADDALPLTCANVLCMAGSECQETPDGPVCVDENDSVVPITCADIDCHDDPENPKYYCNPDDLLCYPRYTGCEYIDASTGLVVVVGGGEDIPTTDCNECWCDLLTEKPACTRRTCGSGCDQCDNDRYCQANVDGHDTCEKRESCRTKACSSYGTKECQETDDGPVCVCDEKHTGEFCEYNACESDDDCVVFGKSYCQKTGFCVCYPGYTGREGGCNVEVPICTSTDTTSCLNDATVICKRGTTAADGTTAGGIVTCPNDDPTVEDDAVDSGTVSVGNCTDLEKAKAVAADITSDLAIEEGLDLSNIEVEFDATTADDICTVKVTIRSSEVSGMTTAAKTSALSSAQAKISAAGFTFFTLTTCDDTIKNGDETGVDCGGSCSACPTCSDSTHNGDEDGVDCGGSCAAECPDPTCSDNIENGDEAGVDCGGSCDDACAADDDMAAGASSLAPAVGVVVAVAAVALAIVA